MKSRVMRFLVAALAVVFMMGMFFGCADSAATDAEKIKLTLRSPAAGEAGQQARDWLANAIGKFEKAYPQYVIETDYVDVETHRNKLKVEMAGGNLPSIFMTWGYDYSKPAADNGMMLDITNELNKDPEWKNGLHEAAINAFTYDGKVMGLSVEGFTEGLFYNKEIFEQLKLSPIVTYDDLLAAVKAANDAGIVPIAVGLKDRWSADFFPPHYFERIAGYEVYQKLMKGEGDWNNPDYVKAVKMCQEMAKMDAFPQGAVGMGWAEARSLVGNGKALFFPGGTWDIKAFYSSEFAEGTGDKIGFINFPSIEGGKGDQNSIIAGFSSGYAINNKLTKKEKEGAVEFFKILTSKESFEFLTYNCSVLSAGKFEVDESKVNKLFAEAITLLNNCSPQYLPYNEVMHPGFAEVWHEFNVNLMDKAVGDMTADELLGKLSEEYKNFYTD